MLIQKLFLPFQNFIKKFRRARLCQIRGYHKLKQLEQLDGIPLIKQKITEEPLNLTNKHFSGYLVHLGHQVVTLL
jgi:hypothetical protein